jgi:hypothetical protein
MARLQFMQILCLKVMQAARHRSEVHSAHFHIALAITVAVLEDERRKSSGRPHAFSCANAAFPAAPASRDSFDRFVPLIPISLNIAHCHRPDVAFSGLSMPLQPASAEAHATGNVE